LVLSTGEQGLAEKMEEDGIRVKAGQTVRLIDIPADAGADYGMFENLHGHESAQAFADSIKRAVEANYGHLARAFIGRNLSVQKHRDVFIHKLAEYQSKICPAEADGQVRRVAEHFLLCALAGWLASKIGLLPWPELEAWKAAKVCFQAWLKQRGGAGAHEDKAILEQVRLFFEHHGSSRFERLPVYVNGNSPPAVGSINPGDERISNRAGFMETKENGATVYYVLTENFKEICKGHDHKRAARVLRDARFLQTSEEGRLTTKPPKLPGLGRPRCYALCFDANGDADAT
jgi:putative DNA primase/helicase